MAKTVAGAGAALVDLLIEESDAFLAKLGVEKGGMNLVDASDITRMLGETSAEVSMVPGGSACNTIVGLGKLGDAPHFLGRIGTDEQGTLFQKNIADSGVKAALQVSETTPTGRVLSVVNPDAQRTMFTFLGAAAEMTPELIPAGFFKDVDVLILEGYLAFNEPYFMELLKQAKENQVEVALDLSSFDVVNICRPVLEKALQGGVSILIANEDEAKAFTGKEEAEALEALAPLVDMAVVKLGARGSLIARGDERWQADALMVDARDTTGAGDLWAAGFLYGYSRDWTPDKCANLGSAVAAEVVQVLGTVIPAAGWERVAQAIKGL